MVGHSRSQGIFGCMPKITPFFTSSFSTISQEHLSKATKFFLPSYIIYGASEHPNYTLTLHRVYSPALTSAIMAISFLLFSAHFLPDCHFVSFSSHQHTSLPFLLPTPFPSLSSHIKHINPYLSTPLISGGLLHNLVFCIYPSGLLFTLCCHRPTFHPPLLYPILPLAQQPFSFLPLFCYHSHHLS